MPPSRTPHPEITTGETKCCHPAKIEANRANAQHSTGPRTSEGKHSSSQNALKQGLNSPPHPLVRETEREAFAQLRQELRAQLLPSGALEEGLFAKLVHAAWNLRRLRQLEESLFLTHDDPFTDEDAASKMNSYARHTARFERVYHNALRDLRQLQTDRALTVQSTKSAPAKLTALTDITKLLKQIHHELPKSARPIPFADEPSLQDLENALCTNQPLYNLLTPEPTPAAEESQPSATSTPYPSLVPPR